MDDGVVDACQQQIDTHLTGSDWSDQQIEPIDVIHHPRRVDPADYHLDDIPPRFQRLQ